MKSFVPFLALATSSVLALTPVGSGDGPTTAMASIEVAPTSISNELTPIGSGDSPTSVPAPILSQTQSPKTLLIPTPIVSSHPSFLPTTLKMQTMSATSAVPYVVATGSVGKYTVTTNGTISGAGGGSKGSSGSSGSGSSGLSSSGFGSSGSSSSNSGTGTSGSGSGSGSGSSSSGNASSSPLPFTGVATKMAASGLSFLALGALAFVL